MEVDLSERRIRLEVGRVVSEAQEILLEVGVLGLADGGGKGRATWRQRSGGRHRRGGGSGKAASTAAVEHERAHEVNE